jgi:hypothetical protein
MPANVEMLRTVRAISVNLDEAIAFYEIFVPTGQDTTLIDRINAVDFYPAFNAISDALHQCVIATLCRIWDARRDTADLNSRTHRATTRQPSVSASPIVSMPMRTNGVH